MKLFGTRGPMAQPLNLRLCRSRAQWFGLV